jgi:hypothetical protein
LVERATFYLAFEDVLDVQYKGVQQDTLVEPIHMDFRLFF